MKKLTEQDGKSLDMVTENLDALKGIFPEAFNEDGVNFEVLRELLGDAVVEGEEKYGLTWYGKKKARQIALTPSLGTLRPCKEESVDWDTTQNLFIEGDNLEVLKLLQKSYANKVKMIYIDPPYNKGKDFVYPDNYQDNLDTYLKYTGQINSYGMKFSSNTESSGRKHTNWLNMMFPRLKLAKNLLSNDGIIFISIDEDELINLEKICEEIFGDENVLGNFPVIMNLKGNQDAFGFAETHEYFVACCKSKDECEINKFPIEEEALLKEWLEDKYGLYKVADNLRATGVNAPREKRPNLWYPIFLNETTKEIYCTDNDQPLSPTDIPVWPINPEGIELSWYWGKSTFSENRHNLIIKKTTNGWQFYRKQRPQLGDSPTKKPKSFFYKPEYSTSTATTKLKELLKTKVFDGPKPIPFIKDLIILGSNKDSIVLDFFCGSGTTAHALMEQNKSDGGERRYILVQLPEPTDEKSEAHKEGYKTIVEIGKERIRRGAAKIKKENPEYEGDLGFKIFKLDSSNIRAWNPDRNDLEQTLIDHMEHLVEDRSEEDILYELLLKRGVDLTVPIEEKTITGKTVYSIGYGVLFACLVTSINREDVEDLAMGIIDWHKELEPASDTHVVFRDSAFASDIAKTNMTAILEQHGIAHVRSF